MKRIILMRHAKSSWSHPMLSDHDRPLNERGKRDAPIMAGRIVDKGILPNMILSSDSKRTRETAAFLVASLTQAEVIYDRSLYLASESGLFEAIRELSDTYDTVMLLAHNPGITAAFELLAKVRIDNVPTAGVGCIEFDVDRFSDIEAGTGTLRYFTYPKMV